MAQNKAKGELMVQRRKKRPLVRVDGAAADKGQTSPAMNVNPAPETLLVPPPLNAAYDVWMHRVALASRYVGLNVRLGGMVDQLKDAEILVFNHFTRVETLVPPYLLFKETGAVCRSVADHGLFTAHPLLGKALREAGAVPNNMPGLLPFLAKEILRGRKVVIFPEGRLVKDKRVQDTSGEFGLRYRDGTFRKQHRGAAVLATHLAMLRMHLQDVLERGDADEIQHWLLDIGLPDVPALRRAVEKVTLMVPSTITFFPLRSEGNQLTRWLGRLWRDMPESVVDEVALEGNLLLRPTDMDVMVQTPLPVTFAPTLAEKLIWRQVWREVRTVEGFFDLEQGVHGWLRPLLEQRLNHAVHTLRDRTARALYGGLMVNLHHVVSQVVHELVMAGVMRVPAETFERALFWALYRLREQAVVNPALRLHESVGDARMALDALLGRGHRLERFLDMLRAARLVKRRGRGAEAYYELSHRLRDVLPDETIRLENPVQVHVNEAGAQPAVRLAAVWALQEAGKTPGLPLGEALWELMQVADGAVVDAARPQLLKPAEGNGNGVVLIHGLSDTPAQMTGLGAKLLAEGYTVLLLRLPGHGSEPLALLRATAKDWLAEAERGVILLRAFGLAKVGVMGFSTGALVALRMAQKNSLNVAYAVALAPPLELVSWRRYFLTFGLILQTFLGWVPGVRRVIPRWENLGEPKLPGGYSRVPLQAVAQLRALARLVMCEKEPFEQPVLLLHGDADETASFRQTQRFCDARVGVRCDILSGAGHHIVEDNSTGSWDRVLDWVRGMNEKD